MLIAVTGATGFIGRHFCHAALQKGHHVRGLMRSAQKVDGVEAVGGRLSHLGALDRLADGSDILVHIAGIVRAVDPHQFQVANVDGAEQTAKAAKRAGIAMLLVSSLAARTPECSAYAQSKRSGEMAVRSVLEADRLTILRPPAVYGPGDQVTMPIFQQIERGLMLVPGARNAKFSMIYVGDLVELMLRLIERPEPNAVVEPDDGQIGGYSWSQLGAIASEATGKSIKYLRLPKSLLALPALLCDRLATVMGKPLLLSRDKLGELYHQDWVARGFVRDDWQAQIDFATGVEKTLVWYRDRNWRLTG